MGPGSSQRCTREGQEATSTRWTLEILSIYMYKSIFPMKVVSKRSRKAVVPQSLKILKLDWTQPWTTCTFFEQAVGLETSSNPFWPKLFFGETLFFYKAPLQSHFSFVFFSGVKSAWVAHIYHKSAFSSLSFCLNEVFWPGAIWWERRSNYAPSSCRLQISHSFLCT